MMAVIMMIKQFFKLCWLHFVITQFVQMVITQCQVCLTLSQSYVVEVSVAQNVPVQHY